jgi:hypothetical protein
MEGEGENAMSRAFVKEDDGSRPEALPELPVSAAPNLVTARGLRLIEARIAELEAALASSATCATGRCATPPRA